MKSAIVYSSISGNTHKVAQALQAFLGEEATLFAIEQAPLAENYDLIAVGFWVERGSCDRKTAEYLRTLRRQSVFLFGTLGAYPDSAHAKDSLARTAQQLDRDNLLLGTFLCQGKIASHLADANTEGRTVSPHTMTEERRLRHQEAAKHPNNDDLEQACQALTRALAFARRMRDRQ